MKGGHIKNEQSNQQPSQDHNRNHCNLPGRFQRAQPQLAMCPAVDPAPSSRA
jgi:hypothetical protein